MASVHYWELNSYNAHKAVGKWFDLDGLNQEDHEEEVTDWLEELTKKTGELCEEVILGDVEDIPDEYVGSHSISPEYFDFLQAVEGSYLDEEVFTAGISIGFSLDEIEDKYRGQWDSDEDMAEEFFDETVECPEHLRGYIDMEAYAHDLMGDLSECDGHYFWTY
jgi:antirestriction protein